MLDRSSAAPCTSACRRDLAIHPDGAHEEADGAASDDGTLTALKKINNLRRVCTSDFFACVLTNRCGFLLKLLIRKSLRNVLQFA